MHIVVAGGNGLLGRALAAGLRQDGHRVSILTRTVSGSDDVAWDPTSNDAEWHRVIDGADAVFNLAGESIAGQRWSASRKVAILESRVRATRALVRAIRDAGRPPAVFVSGSAIGVYGPHGDEVLTEEAGAGGDFLAHVCEAWEREAQATATVTRLVLLRTGVVLARQGGALPQLALPFRFFAGGPVGPGTQYVSWIHIDDWVDLARWTLATPAIEGPINLTAPNPVTSRQFATTLGRVLGRPAAIAAPAFALRIAVGEMADAIVQGQRVVPARAEAHGFRFRYPELEPALRALYP